VRACGIEAVPVDLTKYLARANAEMRVGMRLAPGEAGNTMLVAGRHLITVNGNDSPERQRFTAIHEVAHIVLELPSRHADAIPSQVLYSYVRRPPEEVICDTFAAECLLPHEFIRKDLINATADFGFVEQMAAKYQASLTCTASRVAMNAPFACAYVLSEDGHVRFAAYSTSMRESRFWISLGIAVPIASVTGQCLRANSSNAVGVVPAHLWTSADPFADVDVNEDVRIVRTWNQALTLISLDSGTIVDDRRAKSAFEPDDDEPLLRELDGNLPWPGGKKRK
jgi:hypothetical protein